MPGFPAHEIQAPVDAIGKINVRTAGRPEHHGVAGRRTRETVRRRIFPVVCLGLDYDSADPAEEQRPAEQPAGDLRQALHEFDPFKSCRDGGTGCPYAEPSPPTSPAR